MLMCSIFVLFRAGTVFKAHKLILAACSKNFAELFESAPPSSSCVVILEATSAENMSALLEFMYKGEVHVSQEALNSFLKAAENLQVNWMTSGQNHVWHFDWIWFNFVCISKRKSNRLKVCQRNMDVWLQRNLCHMNKIEDTKETARQKHHQYHWIRWNKSAIHWWIQVAQDWVLALHHTFSKCTGRSMQHASEINAAHSVNQNGRVCYAMDHVAIMPKMRQLTSDYGKLNCCNLLLSNVKNTLN